MKKVLFLAFLLIAITGCSKSDQQAKERNGDGDGTGSANLGLTAEMTSCSADTDCVRLGYDNCICTACLGEYINKAFKDEIAKKIYDICVKANQSMPTDTYCTMQACMPTGEPGCVSGKCAAKDIGEEDGGGAGGEEGEGGGGDTWSDGFSRSTPPWLTPEMSSCSANNDCVVTSWDCCDYCNGGKPVSINKNFTEAAGRINLDACNENAMCTLKGCVSPVALCFNGKCDMLLWGDLNSRAPINSCSADADCSLLSLLGSIRPYFFQAFLTASCQQAALRATCPSTSNKNFYPKTAGFTYSYSKASDRGKKTTQLFPKIADNSYDSRLNPTIFDFMRGL